MSVHGYARRFVAEVRAREALGDQHAHYHARSWKIAAHKLLLQEGRAPREVAKIFLEIVATLEGKEAP